MLFAVLYFSMLLFVLFIASKTFIVCGFHASRFILRIFSFSTFTLNLFALNVIISCAQCTTLTHTQHIHPCHNPMHTDRNCDHLQR